MLRTRLWMSAVLIAVVVGVLVVDQWLPPVFPFLLLVFAGLSVICPIARTVADVRLIFSVMADSPSPTSSVSEYRIGFVDSTDLGMDDACAAAYAAWRLHATPALLPPPAAT